MKRARLLAAVSSVTAIGCLWLFPIQKEDAKVTSTGTGMGADSGVIQGGGGAGTLMEGDAGECTVNSDCGPDYTVCRAHTCLALPTSECIIVHGQWDDPNAFIFGAYATEPAGVPETSQAIYNYRLAIDELNAAGGLPDSQGLLHPLAAVICNNDPARALVDPDFYQRSLHHLVDDLGVAAIVADLPANELKKAFQTTQDEGKDIFFLSPGAANQDLFDLPDKGLVWNMLGPPKDLADGYADLVRRMERFVAAGGDAGATQLRVAVVINDDPNEVDHELFTELYDAVKPKLFFNGATAKSQKDGNYREFHIGNTGDAGSPVAVGDAINDFAPHVVMSMTGTLMTATDFTPTGQGKEGVAQRIISFVKGGDVDRQPWIDHQYPFFIFSPINAAATTNFVSLLQSSVGSDYRILYQRFLGINIAGADDREVYAEYQTRLRASQKMAIDGFENYYDAIYYLAYAAYQAGVGQLDGRKISSGMTSLNSGAPQTVGPTELGPDGGVNLIEAVFHELKTNGSVLLVGAGGSQFDVQHGVRIDKAGLYCFEYVNGVAVSHQPAEIFDPQKQAWTVIAAHCAAGL